jgi:hypothetical protein
MRTNKFSAFPALDDAHMAVGVVSEDDLLVKTGHYGSEPVARFRTRRADKVKAAARSDLLAVYDRPDSEIRDEITTQFIGDEFLLDSRTFTVRVDVGIVTLRGPVDSEPVGQRLIDAVRQVDGVARIREKLTYPPLERRAHRV